MSKNETPTQDSIINLIKHLSVGGWLMCIGALLAVLSTFLDEYSMVATANNAGLIAFPSMFSPPSYLVIEEWRGALAVLGCVACGVFAVLIFGVKPHPQAKKLTTGALVAAGVSVFMAILIWINIWFLTSMVGKLKYCAEADFGAYLISVASMVCLAGSVLHAKAFFALQKS